jgi:hypothetical protein
LAIGCTPAYLRPQSLMCGLHSIFDVAHTILHAGMQGVLSKICQQTQRFNSLLSSRCGLWLCTAANTHRTDAHGNRLLKFHGAGGHWNRAPPAYYENGPIAASLTSNQYVQRLMGQLGWGMACVTIKGTALDLKREVEMC